MNKFTKLVYIIVSLFLFLQTIENREVLYESSEIIIEEQYFFGIRLDINKNDVLVIRMEIDWKENYDVFPVMLAVQSDSYKNKDYDSDDGSLNESRVQNIQQQIQIRQEEENKNELKYLYKVMPVQSIEEVTKQFPKLGEIDECLICCLELEKSEQIRKTVCFHIFHQECIDSWWKKNKNCPACRKILTKQELLQQKQEKMKNSYIQNILTNKSSTILGTSQNLNFYDSCNDFMFQQGSDKFTIQQNSENKMDKDKNIIVFNNENDNGLKYSFFQSQGEENLEKNYGEQQKYENLEKEQQLQKNQSIQNPFLINKQDFQVSQKLDFEQDQQAVSIPEDDGNKNDSQIKKDANIFKNIILLQSQQTNNKKGRQSIDLINDEYQMQIDSKKESYCQLNSSNEIQSVTKLKKKHSIQLDNVSDSTSCTNKKIQRPDQNKLAKKYFKGNQDYVYFDTESIVSQFKEQQIILQNSKDQQFYDISFFDLNQDSNELNAFYDINFKVIGIKQNGFNQYCQQNDICINGKCDEGTCKCDNNYFGDRCQFEAKDLNKSGQNKLLAAQKWGYFYFNIDDSLKGKQINILTKTQGKYNNLKFFHTFNEYSESVVPNSYFQEGKSLNSQKIKQSY
ncbi:hypothetical protein PPERSA_00182 [Pseudocohnilembus persalinus]|uniref:RING-type domain-containing protein n=1 Tax=Pseudocohnilembus persalinus TaxID=266149 RepID=A0A0V0QQG5_PSEPJ|nr:hypothetical protein PPERSA_00182 [Pseudocohnilembus persalinus]|eukprot:KRX04413.1 hypothetical protein PPERSA_00182 [Pseudocohnilembus persalinus]